MRGDSHVRILWEPGAATLPATRPEDVIASVGFVVSVTLSALPATRVMMVQVDNDGRDARFERLFRSHHDAVLAYARRRVSLDVVDDVVEETFLVAWRRLDEVPSDPLPWLYGVARNVIGTQSRGAARRRALDARLAGVSQPPVAGLPDPERFGGVIAAALMTLSPEDREALILVAWEELAPRQAARALGESAVAFRVRLHRARKRLRALLEQGEDASDPGPAEVLA